MGYPVSYRGPDSIGLTAKGIFLLVLMALLCAWLIERIAGLFTQWVVGFFLVFGVVLVLRVMWKARKEG